MADSFNYILEKYDNFVEEYGDYRTKHWFMVRTPIPAIILVTCYLLFVKVIGPKFMENRKPYKLRAVMIGYSAIQAFLALLFFILGSIYAWFTRYNWICQPITHHPDDLVIVQLAWGFYMIRFFEFTDTVIFILRKKYNQITTLHVVHHSMVPLLFWIGTLTSPVGQCTLAAYINAFVHAFMYTYYMLAAMGPKYKKYIWWKIHMTKLQLAQFIFIVAHQSNILISGCDTPKLMVWITLSQALLFFCMFLHFYMGAFFKEKLNSDFLGKFFSMKTMRMFGEMCIPNQHHLLEDSPSEKEEKANGTHRKNNITRRKTQQNSR